VIGARGVRLFGCAALAAGAAGLVAAQERTPGKDKDEKVERPIPYAAPAPEMRRITALLGRWTGRQSWREPLRYKRGKYEGYPGEEGHAVRSVEEGPGGLSLVWVEEGRGPMGAYEARGLLSWDPAAKAFRFDSVHSLIPGIQRLAGAFEDGALVFRGDDFSTGEKRALRVTWKDVSDAGFTELVEASERRATFRPVVTTTFRKESGQASEP
jgi:hypothetical protein